MRSDAVKYFCSCRTKQTNKSEEELRVPSEFWDHGLHEASQRTHSTFLGEIFISSKTRKQTNKKTFYSSIIRKQTRCWTDVMDSRGRAPFDQQGFPVTQNLHHNFLFSISNKNSVKTNQPKEDWNGHDDLLDTVKFWLCKCCRSRIQRVLWV